MGPGLRVLFIGFNPSPVAYARGHYYANPRNRFWQLLHAAGLTCGLLASEADVSLPAAGIGLMDLVDRPTASAGELRAEELTAGGVRVRETLARLRPLVAAYTGKGVYRVVAGRAAAYGPAGSCVAGVTDFVLPSPSGRSGLPWADKVRWYRELAVLLPPTPR